MSHSCLQLVARWLDDVVKCLDRMSRKLVVAEKTAGLSSTVTWEREANCLFSLRHPIIVSYIDYIEAIDASFLAIE